jgi:alpha-amylase/alpha-mannosidase (GH57 family)
MSAKNRLKVVLCWHMHQPHYQDRLTGEYRLPWTYLHAIKDYVDMAAHLESVPKARAVVNFTPTLLEQIADYAAQVKGALSHGGTIHDPMLAALELPLTPNDADARIHLIKGCVRSCLRLNRQRLVDRFPAYQHLADLASWLADKPEAMFYVNQQFVMDMVVWYHLAWLGETVRLQDARIMRLIQKGNGFSLQDRRELLEVVAELLGGIIARYRALGESGQVELSITPYGHPILPLLLDLNTAREAMPDVRLPRVTHYPGGMERARWHIKQGLEVFEHYLGLTPKGCWPAEGGIGAAALKLLDEFGFKWAASGQGVLRNSQARLASEKVKMGCGAGLYRPYRVDGMKVACFFRDDGLSDLIGFTYANWKAEDAINDFIHHLENIAAACQNDRGSVVSVILDGENAWEYYPENGYPFLSGLYQRLVEHPEIELSTFSACLEGRTEPGKLADVVAGSWVYGTFSTWIGDPQKNRGWELLIEAKDTFDTVVASGRLTAEQLAAAERQLAICEGSDWFWWFGDYNPEATVSDFDRLFRLHLSSLYQILGEPPPEYLAEVIARGGGRPLHGGTMRASSQEPQEQPGD